MANFIHLTVTVLQKHYNDSNEKRMLAVFDIEEFVREPHQIFFRNTYSGQEGMASFQEMWALDLDLGTCKE